MRGRAARRTRGLRHIRSGCGRTPDAARGGRSRSERLRGDGGIARIRRRLARRQGGGDGAVGGFGDGHGGRAREGDAGVAGAADQREGARVVDVGLALGDLQSIVAGGLERARGGPEVKAVRTRAFGEESVLIESGHDKVCDLLVRVEMVSRSLGLPFRSVRVTG